MTAPKDPFIEKLGSLQEIRHLAAKESTPYGEILELLHNERLPSVVLTRNGKVSGIFTERDILTKTLLEETDPSTPISALMTPDPVTINSSDTIRDAIAVMHERRIRNLPLLDDAGRVVGMLTVGRIIRYLSYHFPSEVMNLPPKPSQSAEQVEGA